MSIEKNSLYNFVRVSTGYLFESVLSQAEIFNAIFIAINSVSSLWQILARPCRLIVPAYTSCVKIPIWFIMSRYKPFCLLAGDSKDLVFYPPIDQGESSSVTLYADPTSPSVFSGNVREYVYLPFGLCVVCGNYVWTFSPKLSDLISPSITMLAVSDNDQNDKCAITIDNSSFDCTVTLMINEPVPQSSVTVFYSTASMSLCDFVYYSDSCVVLPCYFDGPVPICVRGVNTNDLSIENGLDPFVAEFVKNKAVYNILMSRRRPQEAAVFEKAAVEALNKLVIKDARVSVKPFV